MVLTDERLANAAEVLRFTLQRGDQFYYLDEARAIITAAFPELASPITPPSSQPFCATLPTGRQGEHQR